MQFMAGCFLPCANQFHFIQVIDFEKWIGSYSLPQHLKFKTANLVWRWGEAWLGGGGTWLGLGGGALLGVGVDGGERGFFLYQ